MKTESLKAFLESLDLPGPVTSAPGRILPGPPPWILDVILLLAGGRVFDRPAAQQILENIGVSRADTSRMMAGLRRRSQWLPRWLALADEHAALAQEAETRGDWRQASLETRNALALRGAAIAGDGYYFFTPMPRRLKVIPESRRLYYRLLTWANERFQRLEIAHERGVTPALLHWPRQRAERAPALAVLHGLGGTKEDWDRATEAFREAGYATLSLDLPAHGEAANGPRLWPEAEAVGVAALEHLARRNDIDRERIGLLGGSLGAFYALRAAAVSRIPKVVVSFASPFDIGTWLPRSVRGLQDNFAWVLGARTLREGLWLARPLNLYGVPEQVACPVFLGHGTNDHFVFFTTVYEIARRLSVPVHVQPYVGADHEVALPGPPHISGPAVAWLRERL